jgi:hypothetical protein
MPGGMTKEGGAPLRRERYAPMQLFALVPALSPALAPGLSQLAHVRDDETLCQAVTADVAHRVPRTLLDGRPSPPSRSSCGCWGSSPCRGGAPAERHTPAEAPQAGGTAARSPGGGADAARLPAAAHAHHLRVMAHATAP